MAGLKFLLSGVLEKKSPKNETYDFGAPLNFDSFTFSSESLRAALQAWKRIKEPTLEDDVYLESLLKFVLAVPECEVGRVDDEVWIRIGGTRFDDLNQFQDWLTLPEHTDNRLTVRLQATRRNPGSSEYGQAIQALLSTDAEVEYRDTTGWGKRLTIGAASRALADFDKLPADELRAWYRACEDAGMGGRAFETGPEALEKHRVLLDWDGARHLLTFSPCKYDLQSYHAQDPTVDLASGRILEPKPITYHGHGQSKFKVTLNHPEVAAYAQAMIDLFNQTRSLREIR